MKCYTLLSGKEQENYFKMLYAGIFTQHAKYKICKCSCVSTVEFLIRFSGYTVWPASYTHIMQKLKILTIIYSTICLKH